MEEKDYRQLEKLDKLLEKEDKKKNLVRKRNQKFEKRLELIKLKIRKLLQKI